MRALDRLLQRWRVAKVRPYVSPDSRVLDIGSADGALYKLLPRVGAYVGVEPDLPAPVRLSGNARLLRGLFPEALGAEQPFDVICLLAVLEHVPPEAQGPLAAACAEWLRPGGRLVITVPSSRVDAILEVLRGLRLVDGMSLEQHYGFDVAQTPAIFRAAGLELERHATFQLGLNNVFVFQRPSLPRVPGSAARERTGAAVA